MCPSVSLPTGIVRIYSLLKLLFPKTLSSEISLSNQIYLFFPTPLNPFWAHSSLWFFNSNNQWYKNQPPNLLYHTLSPGHPKSQWHFNNKDIQLNLDISQTLQILHDQN